MVNIINKFGIFYFKKFMVEVINNFRSRKQILDNEIKKQEAKCFDDSDLKLQNN